MTHVPGPVLRLLGECDAFPRLFLGELDGHPAVFVAPRVVSGGRVAVEHFGRGHSAAVTRRGTRD